MFSLTGSGKATPGLTSTLSCEKLEPRPEGYLNLGRAQWFAGRRDEARLSFATAVRLDPRLASQVPGDAR